MRVLAALTKPTKEPAKPDNESAEELAAKGLREALKGEDNGAVIAAFRALQSAAREGAKE